MSDCVCVCRVSSSSSVSVIIWAAVMSSRSRRSWWQLMYTTYLSHIVIHLSYTGHTPVVHLLYTSHTPVAHLSYTCHTPVTHLSYTCHAPVVHLPYTSHTPVTHLSRTCHTSYVHSLSINWLIDLELYSWVLFSVPVQSVAVWDVKDLMGDFPERLYRSLDGQKTRWRHRVSIQVLYSKRPPCVKQLQLQDLHRYIWVSLKY